MARDNNDKGEQRTCCWDRCVRRRRVCVVPSLRRALLAVASWAGLWWVAQRQRGGGGLGPGVDVGAQITVAFVRGEQQRLRKKQQQQHGILTERAYTSTNYGVCVCRLILKKQNRLKSIASF